jgi:methyl-accepting chemotaxis protein
MILPVSFAGLMLLVALIRLGSAQHDLAEEFAHELGSVSTLRADLAQADALVQEYIATGEEDLRVEFDELTVTIEENLEHAGHFDEPDEVQRAHAAASSWRSAQRDAQALFAAEPGSAGGRAEGAVAHLEAARRELRALDDLSRDELHDATEGSAASSRVVVAIALIIGACATVVNIILVRRLLKATFAPLRHLIRGAGRFGSSDLGYRVEPIGDREFQEVGESFNAMADRLQATFESLEHRAFHDALTDLPNRGAR